MGPPPIITAIEPLERDARSGRLITDAVELAADISPNSQVIGYTILAFYSDGASRSAGYRPNTTDHKIGSAMYEAWARAALEKHFVWGEGIEAANAVMFGAD